MKMTSGTDKMPMELLLVECYEQRREQLHMVLTTTGSITGNTSHFSSISTNRRTASIA